MANVRYSPGKTRREAEKDRSKYVTAPQEELTVQKKSSGVEVRTMRVQLGEKKTLKPNGNGFGVFICHCNVFYGGRNGYV